MKKKILLACTGILSFAFTCEKLADQYAYGFWIQNNSRDTILYLVGKQYPDTSVPDDSESVAGLLPGARRTCDSQTEWKSVFNALPADTLSLFFFNRDTFVRYGFEKMRTDYNIISRKDISFADLTNNNYTVSYP